MFDDKTRDGILAALLEDAGDAGFSTLEGSLPALLAGGTALELMRLYASLRAMTSIFYVDETSGVWIDTAAAMLGLTRKAGTQAEAALVFAGTAGTVVPAGTAFLTATGLRYELEADVTLSSAGSGTGTVMAEMVGSAYNVDAGAIDRMYLNLSGLTSFTAAASAGGSDGETDAALVARFYARLQMPATSGNVSDYQEWALAVDGVGYVRIIPLASGNGTVTVVVADSSGKAVGSSVVSACAAYIETQRPIGATVSVLSGAEKAIAVTASVGRDGTRSVSEITADFTASFESYLKGLIFTGEPVRLAKVSALLMAVSGVSDVTSVTLNGTAGNIVLGDAEIPTVGTVSIT